MSRKPSVVLRSPMRMHFCFLKILISFFVENCNAVVVTQLPDGYQGRIRDAV
jgi:hypothetical protein